MSKFTDKSITFIVFMFLHRFLFDSLDNQCTGCAPSLAFCKLCTLVVIFVMTLVGMPLVQGHRILDKKKIQVQVITIIIVSLCYSGKRVGFFFGGGGRG